MKERSTVFDTVSISEGFFIGANRVNCAAPFCEYLYPSDDRPSLIDFTRNSRRGKESRVWHR